MASRILKSLLSQVKFHFLNLRGFYSSTILSMLPQNRLILMLHASILCNEVISTLDIRISLNEQYSYLVLHSILHVQLTKPTSDHSRGGFRVSTRKWTSGVVPCLVRESANAVSSVSARIHPNGVTVIQVLEK